MVGDKERGSLPIDSHKHLCAANLRTETDCPGVALGQERDRREAGGDRRESGRGQLCRESGATSSRHGATSVSSASSGAPRTSGPAAQLRLSPARGAPGGLLPEQPRGGQPGSRGRGTAACVFADRGGALRPRTPLPRSPLAVRRDPRLLRRTRVAASRAGNASAAERKASAATAGLRTLSSWMSRSVDLSMERN